MPKLLSWYVVLIFSVTTVMTMFYYGAINLRGNDNEVLIGVAMLFGSGFIGIALSYVIAKEISNFLKSKKENKNENG